MNENVNTELFVAAAMLLLIVSELTKPAFGWYGYMAIVLLAVVGYKIYKFYKQL